LALGVIIDGLKVNLTCSERTSLSPSLSFPQNSTVINKQVSIENVSERTVREEKEAEEDLEEKDPETAVEVINRTLLSSTIGYRSQVRTLNLQVEKEVKRRKVLEQKVYELEDEIERLESSKEHLKERLEESENVRESWEKQIGELEKGLREQDLRTQSWYQLVEERGIESIKQSREITELKMRLYLSETRSGGRSEE
jgi:chromosome segregation ATPase